MLHAARLDTLLNSELKVTPRVQPTTTTSQPILLVGAGVQGYTCAVGVPQGEVCSLVERQRRPAVVETDR